MDRAIVDVLLPALEAQTDLLGAYTVPASGDGYFLSNHSKPTLLLLLGDRLQIHVAREVIRDAQGAWRDTLEEPPLVFTPDSFARYVRLFPLFGHHVASYSERICGLALALNTLSRPHPVERLSFLIAEAVSASAALTPQDAGDQALLRLRRLDDTLTRREDNQLKSAADLFARVQVQLRMFIDSLPPMAGHRMTVVKRADAPNLIALYEDRERLLVVIPPLSANLLRSIDWSVLSTRLTAQLTTLNVATADQLYIIIQSERPMDFVLGSFRRRWGADILAGLTVSSPAVFRQAARIPLALLIDGILGDYLLALDDNAVHKVIHDYQNRLLNVRLAHDMLCRFLEIPVAEPATALPRRDEPLPERIDAIAEHLEWWTDHYLRQMESHPTTEKLGPR